jgi:branched-chain amino acid transport system ATP-binding protein
MNTFLQLNDIELKYGNILALKGISLAVGKGDVVSLIGANGAGKSTLLKAIAGIRPIAKGTILFDGETIIQSEEGKKKFFSRSSSLRADTIVSRGISLVPEGRGVFADMTVFENLEMGAFLVRDKKKISLQMMEIFETFPILQERRKQKAGSLSGGEQQMLAIGRALMNNPRILLLDEPALGLAPLVIKNIFQTISRISRDNGVTVFLVEQNAKMALSVSKKGYVMETGRIVMEDTSEKLLSDPRVKAAYLGE